MIVKTMTDRRQPLVSVIMNCHNSQTYLRAAIESVYRQTYDNWEIVFWDNASTDNSAQIANSYDQRLRYFYGDRKVNLYAARNYALKKAAGEFIAFLDCDDEWQPQKLTCQIPLFEDPEVGVVFSDAIYFDNAGNSKQLYKTRPFVTGWCFRQLMQDYFLCLQTIVIRKAVFETLEEWFDPRFNIAGDTDLVRRTSARWKLDMVKEPLALYRIHNESLGFKSQDMLIFETACMLEKYQHLYPDFADKYPRELLSLQREHDVLVALKCLSGAKNRQARNLLQPYMLSGRNYLILYLLTFFPTLVFRISMRLRRMISPLKYQ